MTNKEILGIDPNASQFQMSIGVVPMIPKMSEQLARFAYEEAVENRIAQAGSDPTGQEPWRQFMRQMGRVK